ncbi:MAG: PilT/PilU family type 4a pilus ATPase [Phascolarctobacterium sp.]|nr:PilT/PilU family type 4a pilus ATPase [Phascolarctobacterium sp.]
MFTDLFSEARKCGASDIHLTTNSLPIMRIMGKLEAFSKEAISHKQFNEFIALLPTSVRTQLEQLGEADCAWCWGEERYRLNIYRESEHYAMAIRLLQNNVPSTEELGLPDKLVQLMQQERGLVLVAGSTGSGKSTTLAALVQKINATRAVHILTLEDPIEYTYPKGMALIHQREVGRDTSSFANGLRSALREDPDVILVGELRDSETMSIALTAAETGHLVLATLHTQDVTSSVNRILDMLPQNQQQVRSQLAECFLAVACQRLQARLDGQGRVAAFELLLATDAVRHLIREGQTHQLQSYLQTGARAGMQTMQASIAMLKHKGII